MNLRVRIALALSAVAAAYSIPSQAQQYPVRSIRMVVAFPPGGPVDIVARSLAPRLTEALGQSVVIDNRSGAAGIVGSEAVAKATPDGYTVIMAASTIAIQESLYSKLPYDTLKDFAPVIATVAAPLLLVVHPSLPVRDVKGLVALAKARPGQLVYASPGSGSANHLAVEIMKSTAGFSAVHIPYKGGAPAESDLIGGHVVFMFATIASGLGHVKAGKLRALGVSWNRRSPAAPDIPTIAESGIAGFDAGTWYGVLGPAGMPATAIGRLNRDTNASLRHPEFKQRMDVLGVEVTGGTPEEFGAFIRSEIAKWGKAVKDSGAKAD